MESLTTTFDVVFDPCARPAEGPIVRDNMAVLNHIPADGTDVTMMMNDAVKMVPDGTRLMVLPGSYRMDGTCLIEDRSGISIEALFPDQPPTFYTDVTTWDWLVDPNDRKHFFAEGGEDISFRNLRVDGPNRTPDPGNPGFMLYSSTYAFQAGFAFHTVDGGLIEGCVTDHTWGDGITIGGNGKSRDITVRNVLVQNNGRQGIAVTNAENVIIDGFNITNSRRSAVDLEPPSLQAWVRGIVLANGVSNSKNFALSSGGGEVSDLYAHDWQVLNEGAPVYAQGAVSAAEAGLRRRGWRIQRLSTPWTNSPQPPFRFRNTDDVSIEDCVIVMGNRQGSVAQFYDCQGALSVTGCDFREGGRYVEVQAGSSDVTLANNQPVLYVVVS